MREAVVAGHNYRMPNPLAALGYHQLLRLDELNRKRIALANRYDALLESEFPGIRTPVVSEGAPHVYQMYTIEVDRDKRDAIVLALRECGVGASVHFDPPVHLHPYYRELGTRLGMFPVTEQLVKGLITLPMYPSMTEADQDWVVHCLKTALRKAEVECR